MRQESNLHCILHDEFTARCIRHLCLLIHTEKFKFLFLKLYIYYNKNFLFFQIIFSYLL